MAPSDSPNGASRRLLGILLLAHLVACTSWRVQAVTPEALIRDRAPATIRITRTDHSRVVVHRPVVEGDSVAGLLSRDEPKDGAAAPITISLNAIESVAIRRFDVLKTVGVVLLVDLAWCAATQCLADPGIP